MVGGGSNPLSVIEQLTYLLFIKRLDELQTRRENKAARTKQPIEEPIFTDDEQRRVGRHLGNPGDDDLLIVHLHE